MLRLNALKRNSAFLIDSHKTVCVSLEIIQPTESLLLEEVYNLKKKQFN